MWVESIVSNVCQFLCLGLGDDERQIQPFYHENLKNCPQEKKASKDKDWLSFGGKKTILQFVNCPPCFKTPRVFQTIPEFFQVVFLDGNKTIRFRDPKKVGGGSSHT